MTKKQPIEILVHNTRLFPKGKGADSYRLRGIAERCDWAIMTDSPGTEVSLRGDFTKQPRTVFLSLRSFFHAIPYFYEEILPRINGRFVLITGSEDITIPNQVDARWRAFNAREKELITRIIEDERVIHWFAENRDEDRPKMSTLPVGYVFTDESPSVLTVAPPDTLLRDRPLKVFCAHRIRDGEQWEVRRKVTALCNTRFQDFTTVIMDEMPEAIFRQQVRLHPFVICTNGGGLDPSPKAWFSIVNGSIPIIRSTVLDDAYARLPVVIVDEWTEDCLSMEKLNAWVKQFAPYYDNDYLRARTLHRLSLDYWWNRIVDLSG